MTKIKMAQPAGTRARHDLYKAAIACIAIYIIITIAFSLFGG